MGRPARAAMAALLLAVFAVGVLGCAAPAPGTEPEFVVRPGAPGSPPDLLAAPRVEPLSKRGWVRVKAAVLASDRESPVEARRRALQRARQAAIEFVAGVSVRSSVVHFDRVHDRETEDLLQALTATQSDALIVEERLQEARVELSDAGGYRVVVALDARVLDHDRGARAGFETEVRLDKASYRPGDPVALSVRVSQPARIYVLAVSDSGATVLLPNRHLPDTRIEADRWLEFPGETLEGRGVSLRAMLAPDRDRAREALIVVALRGRRRLADLVPAAGGDALGAFRSAEGSDAMALASDFLSPLLSIPAEDWTFDQLVYSIERD